MPAAWLLLTYLSLLAIDTIGAFNLDVKNTIIKDGEKGSFFGFSVALHKQLRPDPMSWLLVGAPQASALPTQHANRTGGLYQCPLTAEPGECTRVDIDSDVDTSRESKENQWLGVTVKSQGPGGKIVTCAHLYESRQRVMQASETRDVIGRCYILSEDLSISDELDGGEWKFCEGRPQGHEMFGFCQQGMSAGFSIDNNYIMFGAPGTYNWKGLLFVTNIDSSNPDQLVYKTLEPTDKAAMLNHDVVLNSYLGFSVASGWGVTGRNKLSFVSGAPRANHTGAVIILRKDSGSQLIPEVTLWGETLASSFGYSVAVEDLNNDGWTDVLVGAPNYFSRKEEIGGAVYIYMNKDGKLDSSPPLRLNGTDGSMFGIVVSSLGDMNLDGYKDIAIGAPFDDNGKVFIYFGSRTGLITKPAQVLDGIGAGVRTFGYSLSGGLDIDGNSYPDLAVGSLSDTVVLYRSRNVIRLHKDVTINPQQIDLEQQTCKHTNGICVDLRACFSYTAQPQTYNPRIILRYVFEAEEDRRRQGKSSRVFFLKRQPSDPDYKFTSTVELPRQGSSHCVTATFQLQDGIKDKLRSIPIALKWDIHDARKKRQSSVETLPPLLPVLSNEEPEIYNTEVNFLREGCGWDKICQSNLQLNYTFFSHVANEFTPLPIEGNHPVFAINETKDIALKIDITNFPSDRENPHLDGDDAHEAQLIATFPDTLAYSAFRLLVEGTVPSTDKTVICSSNTNASQAICELGNPMKRNAVISFYLIMNTPGINIETTDLEVKLELATISEQVNLPVVRARANVIIELLLSFSGEASPPRLYYSGEIKGESAMVTEEDVGSPLNIEVSVSNSGQKSLRTLGSAFLNLMWPHELINGKWLLYPMKIHLHGKNESGQKMECSPRNAVNPLNLTRVETPFKSVESYHTPSSAIRWPLSYPAKKKDIVLDCARGTANCIVFQCPLYSIEQQMVLKVQGRLWNSTLLEEYSTVSSLEVIIRANITVKSTLEHLVLRHATTQIPVTLYSELGVAAHGGIPWWIILIAVLAGILLLLLLVCILWKCGFFKRSTAESKYTTNYYRAQLGVQPSEADRQAEEEA